LLRAKLPDDLIGLLAQNLLRLLKCFPILPARFSLQNDYFDSRLRQIDARFGCDPKRSRRRLGRPARAAKGSVAMDEIVPPAASLKTSNRTKH
jgi:hypothetical protein